MEVIGKTVDYIKLHDILDRIEVVQVYSTLHSFYKTILNRKNEDGEMEWDGRLFTEKTLKEVAKEEKGVIEKICLSEHSTKLWEMKINFKTGNQFVIRLNDQTQFTQILDYLNNL